MTTANSSRPWEAVFSKCLRDLKEKYPKFSEVQIAERVNIPRATLNRFYNESQKPSLHNYIKVISASGNGHMLEEALRQFDDDFQDVLSVSLRQKNKEILSQELEELFHNRDFFVTYILATNEGGVSKTELREVFGNSADDALKGLLDRDLISERNGRFFTTNEAKNLVRSFESIKYHLETYARFYKVGHVGKGRNYVHSMTDGLNAEGIKALQDTHRRFHAEIQNIMRDDKYRGPTPMFSVAFCDSFTSINKNQEELSQ